MQLNYWKNICPPVDGMQKISSICWSPNGRRMALVGSDRVVQLYNESGEKKDKFPTKASEKG
jgi:intraflagellar transport protein 172